MTIDPPQAHRPRTQIAMLPPVWSKLATPPVVDRLTRLAEVDVDSVLQTFDGAEGLEQVEVLFTGWGAPLVDADALALMPQLRAILHTAGTVKSLVTQACFDRGIVVSSAVDDNAIPVAEYTLAAILFSQKRVIETSRAYRDSRAWRFWSNDYPWMGNYRRTVGVIGASRIGRRVVHLLQPFDVDVLLSDPFVTPEEASALGARLVDLDELFATSDTVSLHAPDLPSTRGMVDGRLLGLLQDGGVFINTARGVLVDQDALTAELVSGRLHAVLDVTDPDVPPTDSPLYDLPNVLLTPHIAGSLGNELTRLVDHALDELERVADGQPLATPVTADVLATSA